MSAAGHSYTLGVDVGGTFTDFFCVNGKGVYTCKTPTTNYDLSVGFMRGIGQLARQLDLSRSQFLERVGSMRYSTTVGTNALIERKGPKLGLLTTAGFEDHIFIGRGRSWADGLGWQAARDQARIRKPAPLIAPEMVVGLKERIDFSGEVLCPLRREQVLSALQTLVDRGAQGFVVSLLWSFVNPAHEQMVREIIEGEYPEDYLGAMPVILSSDVSAKAGEYARTMTTVVNSYIHGIMAEEISRLGNELRDDGFSRPLTLVHNTGGMRKASRTRAVLTHNAGPVAGLHGSAVLGGITGDSNLIFTDMGGTSFDIGLIEGGEIKTHDFIPVIDRWRTNIPAVEVKSIGAGGGSIAWVNHLMAKSLEVGPQSAGSMPGPACYDQGGDQPTVTDADLVLGFYNPDNYLGGEMLLDVELAREAIATRIAEPLGIDVLEAAYRIRRLVDAHMGQEVFNEVALKGHDPRNFALLACGGAGGAHACGFAEFIGTPRVILPPHASVFGAYGASMMNVRQIWERSVSLRFFRWAGQAYLEDLESFNRVVRELQELAASDLQLEGYTEAEIRYCLKLEMRFGSQYNIICITTPKLYLEEEQDVRDICELFSQRYAEIYSPEATYPSGGINVEGISLLAEVPVTPQVAEPAALAEQEPDREARREPRPVCWDSDAGFEETRVFDASGLAPGNSIAGPAIIESAATTYVVNPGWTLGIDPWRNAILGRTAEPPGAAR